MLPNKFILTALFTAALAASIGCNNKPSHPNQINAFDGATYDSLTVAHAALVSLRASIATTQPQYIAEFNQAATTYASAYDAYAAYRAVQTNQSAVAADIANLTISITSLETAFQRQMKVAPSDVARARNVTLHKRAQLAKNITVSDILTELEIAAAVASSIPATQPYSSMAAIVIQVAQDSLAAFGATVGQPVDLSTIEPLAPIH